MAIYHLSAKAVSRSAGRSATAAAAYRAGVEIADERTGEVHDYRRRGGVASADIVLPDRSPDWAIDRAKLWNAAEAAERRKDSCVAREFEVALPAELSPSERRRLAMDFAKDMANREGCAVDVAIHAPGRGGDNRNHHAHILRTTRKVGAEELGEKLDTEKAGRNRTADLEAVRARWAQMTNERLRENGIEARVDHRSLNAQGIDREPTQHLGPAASGYERRTGQASRKREDYELAAAERLERAREAGTLERQGLAVGRSIIELSGDIEAAKRDRAEQKRQEREQAEGQRIEAMSAAELWAEISRLRPAPVRDLVERDQGVKEADRQRQTLEAQYRQAQAREAQAQREAVAWREAHPVRAKLHDMGLEAKILREQLQAAGEAKRTWMSVAPRIDEAGGKASHARTDAAARAVSETAPARAKVARLEDIAMEKQRQEQRRETLGRDFTDLAAKRAAKASGYRDDSDAWKAAPKALRELLDGYNRQPTVAQAAIVKKMTSDPKIAKQLGELLERHQAHERQRDRGMSR